MPDAVWIRRRWRRLILWRWCSLIGLLTGGVTLAALASLGIAGLIAQSIPKPTPFQSSWIMALSVGGPIAALIGLIVAAAWSQHWLAVSQGLRCPRCGTDFDFASFEYTQETGECPHCVRARLHSAEVIPAEFEVAADEGPQNPYAPPRAGPPAAVELPPIAALPQRTTFVHRLFRTVIAAYLGWLSALVIAGFGCFFAVRLALAARSDTLTPMWLAQATRTQVRRDWLRLGVATVGAVVFLIVMLAALDVLWPADLVVHVTRLHFLAGIAAALALWGVEWVRANDRRRGEVVLPSRVVGNGAYLLSDLPWPKSSRRVRFRTQSAAGLALSIEDALTGEALVAVIIPCIEGERWTAFRLPLDDLVARGRNLGRINVWLYPLDGRPWMLQYDEYTVDSPRA